MDEQERATLSDELANRLAIFDREGQSFVFAKVEIIANPDVTSSMVLVSDIMPRAKLIMDQWTGL